MNSRKTNTMSISKDILFHVSKFLEKMPFQLLLEIIKWICQLRSVCKLFQTIGVRYDKFFWPEHVFLKECFSFKTEDLLVVLFWPDCLHISWKCRGQVYLKKLKALEQRCWLNPLETRSQLIYSKSFIQNVTSII